MLVAADALRPRDCCRELETLIALGHRRHARPALLRYASELKPYGLDALVTLLLVWAALRVRRMPGNRGRLGRAGRGDGAGRPCVSTPAVFVLAGHRGRARAWSSSASAGTGRAARSGAIAAAGGAAVAVAAYWTWYRTAAGNAYMRDFWQAALLQPGTPGLATRLRAGVREAIEPAAEWMAALGLGWVLLGLVVLGAVASAATRTGLGPCCCCCTLPIGFAFLASAAGCVSRSRSG